MSRTVRSRTARYCAAALAAGAALVSGAPAGQASTAALVRPEYSACSLTENGNMGFAPGTIIPNDLAYCINGWEYIAQNDGNFVIYNPSGRAVWATDTDVGHALEADFQPDSNFVIYNADTPVWSSGTAVGGGDYLCFQVDGNMVVYSYADGLLTCTGHAIWATGTCPGP